MNADLRVGALEESITVTAASALVDVLNTQKSVVVNRELMDAVPTARNYSGMAALIQGVRMSNTDVGGNQQMEQIYMTVNGSRQTDTTVQVDGLNLNSLMNDGQVQAYYSDAAMAETTYQTSGITADVSTGGVRINLIPKDGGNVFSGQAFVGGTDGSWQANNVTDELQARGLRTGSRVAKIADVNIGIGGPIMRDKLWFFASWRRIATDSVIPRQLLREHRRGWHRRRGAVDHEQHAASDVAGEPEEQGQRVLRPYAIRSSKGTKPSSAPSPNGTARPGDAIPSMRSTTPARRSGPRH